MSITAFAPGAVVVKDGAEHLAVGFAAYNVIGKSTRAKDPLGHPSRFTVAYRYSVAASILGLRTSHSGVRSAANK